MLSKLVEDIQPIPILANGQIHKTRNFSTIVRNTCALDAILHMYMAYTADEYIDITEIKGNKFVDILKLGQELSTELNTKKRATLFKDLYLQRTDLLTNTYSAEN